MSVDCKVKRLRYAFDFTKWETAREIYNQTGVLPRGNDCSIECGIFYGDYTRGATTVNVALYSSLTLEVIDSSGTIVMSKTVNNVDLDPDMTLDGFTGGTEQHVSFSFSNTETQPSLGSANEVTYYMVLSAVATTGEISTPGYGSLTIVEDQHGAGTSPPVGDPSYYTAAETLALINQQWGIHQHDVLTVEDVDLPGTYRGFKSKLVDGVVTLVPVESL